METASLIPAQEYKEKEREREKKHYCYYRLFAKVIF